jgi:hypothetical protein
MARFTIGLAVSAGMIKAESGSAFPLLGAHIIT